MNEYIDSCIGVFEEALSKWSQQPLSALFKTADEAKNGIAYERFVVNERTVALVVCIVRKGNHFGAFEENLIASSSLYDKQPRTLLENQSLAFLLNTPEAFTTTIAATLVNPETILYASLNPQQIQKLEADFLAQVTDAEIEQLGFIPGKFAGESFKSS